MKHYNLVTYVTINMPKIFTSKTQKIGETGENVAVKFLVKQDFIIIDRNYTRKWGEIDIIAKKQNKLYFIEVKSVSCRTLLSNVSYETNNYKPEDNMHPWKIKRLYRTIQTFLMSDKKHGDWDWQIDLLVVYLDLENKKAKVKVIPNIIN